MRLLFLALIPAALLCAQEPPAGDPARFRKELSAAVGKKDPAARVKAVEAYLAQKGLPESWAGTARRELVSSLAKDAPGRAVRWADRAARALPPAGRAELFLTLATSLLGAKGQEAAALRVARRAAETPGASPRQRYAETLGLALRASGRNAEARAALEEALTLNPGAFRAAGALAEIAEAEGRAEEHLRMRAQAFLARPSNESWDKLAAVYGDRGGLEEYLDARYADMYPAAGHPEPYQPAAGRSGRTVLAELYTGAGCPPCAAADLAFDAVLERYAREDVAVVMYHVHIPRPDPMANAATKQRWVWQKGRGVPTHAIDGQAAMGGGGRAEAPAVLKDLRQKIEERLSQPAGAKLNLTVRHEGGAVSARIETADLPAGRANLRLHAVLVERRLRYSGENGIRFHPMVARSIASFELDGGGSVEHRFGLEEAAAALARDTDEFEKHDERHNKDGSFRFRVRMDRIDPANLGVVAYIQDMETREVLQSAYAGAPLAARSAR